jgi:DNA-directed RNA polymerase specialized sigma24 family protein
MTRLQPMHTGQNTANESATPEDFRRVFNENMNGLYQLSLVLTGDHEKAEQCFTAGFDDAVNAHRVFKDWAYSWAKRAIIRNAIRILQPHPDAAGSSIPAIKQERSAIHNLLALRDFERFVFVMSVLEGYSERECAVLLECSLQEIGAARIRAMKQLGSSNQVSAVTNSDPVNAESLVGKPPLMNDSGAAWPAA